VDGKDTSESATTQSTSSAAPSADVATVAGTLRTEPGTQAQQSVPVDFTMVALEVFQPAKGSSVRRAVAKRCRESCRNARV
jgi:hypothetical protein